MGHTMSIHSQNDQIVLEFGLHKPAYRIVVNSPTTLGSIGLTTGLDPSMTLGCGGYGGNITSDNISPRHLLNIKRVAYETTPASTLLPRRTGAEPGALPKAPAPPKTVRGVGAASLALRIDEFLASRGYTPPRPNDPAPRPPTPAPPAATAAGPAPATPAGSPEPKPAPPVEKPTDFVCEDDVRQAMRQGRTILIGEKTIVTPAARDLGEAHKILIQAGWPR